MNILELEDVVKGLPDERLQQEARAPSGQVPQYLLISEVQRRTDMRKRFQAQAQEMPQSTVADRIMQEGIMSAAPPQSPPQMPQTPQNMPPMPTQRQAIPQGMAQGGIVRLQAGGQAPNYTAQNILSAGLDDKSVALALRDIGLPESEIQQLMASSGREYQPDQSVLGEFWDKYNPKALWDNSAYGAERARPSEYSTPLLPAAAEKLPEAASNLWESVKTGFSGAQNYLQDLGDEYALGAAEFDWNRESAPEDQGIAAIPIPDIATGKSGAGDISTQGASKIQTQSKSIIQQLIDAGNEKTDPVDFSRMMEDQRKTGYGNSLVQIGAGIAENKLGAGLARAGDSLAESQQLVGRMGMAEQVQNAESQSKDSRDAIYALASAGQLEAAERAATTALATQRRSDWNYILGMASDIVTTAYKENKMLNMGRPASDITAEMESASIAMAMRMARQMGVPIPGGGKMPIIQPPVAAPTQVPVDTSGWGIKR